MKADSLYPKHIFKNFIFFEVNLNNEYMDEYMDEYIIQALL